MGFKRLLILNLALAASAFAGDESLCVRHSLEEKLGTRAYSIQQITESSTIASSRVARVFGNGDHVLLGIEDDGHAYLLVGNVRYDGETFKSVGSVRVGVQSLSSGIAIRFKNLSAQTIQELKGRLSSQEGRPIWSASCFSGVCTQLEKSGIWVNGGHSLIPSKIFKQILENGFVGTDGAPLAIEIYRNSDQTLASIHEVLRYREAPAVLAAKGIGAFTILTGTGVLIYVAAENSR